MVAVFLLCVCLLLGGGTHNDFLSEFVLQASAAVAVAYFLWRPIGGEARLILVGVVFLLAFAVAQSVLPFARHGAFEILPAGASLDPVRAYSALLSCLPALVIFYAVARGSEEDRTLLITVVLAGVALNVALGILQLAQGPGSRLRFFEQTNPMDAVGLFANRNHFAALLYCGLCLCAGVLLQRIDRRGSVAGATGKSSIALFHVVAGGIFVVVVMIGVMASRSRAAILLSMLALVFATISVVISVRRRGMHSGSLFVLGVGAGGVLLAIQVGLGAVAARFGRDPLADERVAMAATTWDLVWQSMPFGLGFGTFEAAYGAAENRLDLAATYTHRAHNDVLEFLMESGAIGGGLLFAFLAWYVIATVKVWRLKSASEFAAPASLVIFLLLVHSFFDYPLRTTAVQVVFAMCCALLFAPARRYSISAGAEDGHDLVPRVEAGAIVSIAPRREWEGGVAWPKDWK